MKNTGNSIFTSLTFLKKIIIMLSETVYLVIIVTDRANKNHELWVRHLNIKMPDIFIVKLQLISKRFQISRSEAMIKIMDFYIYNSPDVQIIFNDIFNLKDSEGSKTSTEKI